MSTNAQNVEPVTLSLGQLNITLVENSAVPADTLYFISTPQHGRRENANHVCVVGIGSPTDTPPAHASTTQS